MKPWKKIAIAVVILFLAIQLIPVPGMEKITPIPADDFIQIENPPTEIATLIKNACYDCHSYETKLPWYSKISPVSFWLGDHIEEGREHLNFSTWANNDDKNEAREECAEEIEEGEMPLQSYTLMHKEARLSKNQKQALANWFNQNSNGESHKHSDDDHDDDHDDDD